MQKTQVAFVVYCPCNPGAPDLDSLRVKYCTTKEDNVFNKKKGEIIIRTSTGPNQQRDSLVSTDMNWTIFTGANEIRIQQSISVGDLQSSLLWILIIFPFYGPNCQVLFMQVIYLPILIAKELPVPPLWAVNVCRGAYMASNFLPKCTVRETAQSFFSNIG